jgi:KDO2-lipid IV(A) lauroyltransferase
VADHDDDPNLRPPPLRRLRFLLEYLLIASVGWWVRLWPRRMSVVGGGIIGRAAGLALGADRRVAMANLDVVLGDAVPSSRKRQIATRTFVRLGQVVVGLFWAPRLTPMTAAALCDSTDLNRLLTDLRSRGRGVVLATVHYGDWELACLNSGFAGLPIMMVTEPLANPRLTAMFDRLRSCSGNKVIPPKYAVLKLFRGLRRGERVAVMCDVNGRRGRGGVWADFLGRPVFNGVAAAELALRTNAAVVFVASLPQSGGRHVVKVWPVIEPEPSGDHAADVLRVTQRLVDCHAELLKQDPEPWLWTYKRWKRKPSADAPGYPFYASHKRVE